MQDIDKLRILIPHWIEHNAEHAAEFERWARSGCPGCEHILEAIHHMEAANQALQAALEALGGSAEGSAGHPHVHD
ncbi:MAG: hypothetical protein ACUVWB_08575 [Anaerolineae bacterium]